MKAFLRYNARHHIWSPRGYKGRWGLQLNPIESVYDGTWRISLHEPLWVFLLRHGLFCRAGKTKCGGTEATWNWGPDGNRTCSCCGSIHPDDLLQICRKTIVDERYGVEGTTKSYKVYVRQPGVRNAGEGAIKFYTDHAPTSPTMADQQLFANALKVTHERWQKKVSSKCS